MHAWIWPPQGPNRCIFFDFLGLGARYWVKRGLKLTGREGCAGLRRESVDFPDIQKVETLILVILCLNLLDLDKIVRNSSFTRPGGLIIASSRSGTLFSSCLTSSTYFSMTKNVCFLGTTSFCVIVPRCPHPPQPISGPCSIEKYPSSRMANRYTCIFDAG